MPNPMKIRLPRINYRFIASACVPVLTVSYHLPISGSPLSFGNVLRNVSFRRIKMPVAITKIIILMMISSFFSLLFDFMFSITIHHLMYWMQAICRMRPLPLIFYFLFVIHAPISSSACFAIFSCSGELLS